MESWKLELEKPRPSTKLALMMLGDSREGCVGVVHEIMTSPTVGVKIDETRDGIGSPQLGGIPGTR